VESFKRERAAVFCGSGASATAGLPDWQQFVATLAVDLGIGPDLQKRAYSPSMLLNAPQYYENRFGRRRLIERTSGMVEQMSPKPSSTYDLVAQLPCSLFYTTNFDELLEDSLRRAGLTVP
jgi:NAD-dependent SIR2 family protein deacetylase